MRKVFILFIIAGFASCNSSDPKVDSITSGDTTQNDVAYPYTASYSSKFEIGDPKHSLSILNLWKVWDGGDISKAKDIFADSVEMHFEDGNIDKGPRDSIIAHGQSFRSTYDSVWSRVDAFMPLKSTDKGENWVCIWGMETRRKAGKIDSLHLQETWRLNKDGKVDFVLQYKRNANPPKM